MTSQADKRLKKRMGADSKKKKQPIAINLNASDRTLYQPQVATSIPGPVHSWSNVGELNGTVSLYGIPLNIDYSTNRTLSNSLNGFGNGLFKFQFNPALLRGGFENEIQQYDHLRKSQLGGLDLTSYTKELVMDQLSHEKGGRDSVSEALQQYLQDPRHVSELLTMNDDQIKGKLEGEITRSAAGKKAAAASYADSISYLKAQSDHQQNELQLLEKLSKDTSLAAKISKDDRAGILKDLSLNELKARLAQYAAKDLQEYGGSASDGRSRAAAKGTASHITFSESERDTVLSRLAAEVYQQISSEQAVALKGALDKQQTQLGQARQASLSSLQSQTQKSEMLPGVQVAAVAGIISDLKERLQSKGYDVGRLLQVENLVSRGIGSGTLSEMEGSFYQKRPANALQSLLGSFSSVKFGSFGERVPGSTESGYLFLTGTHVAFNTINVPVTIGFGTVNDVSAQKDSYFQNSIYNTPRSVTYLAANLRSLTYGDLKVSVIAGVNRSLSTSLYQLPTASSNNVVFTVSKMVNFGEGGILSMDFSKSAMLYDNKYQIGSDILIDRKNGLSNSNSDLFEALSIGFSHNLNLPGLANSDNVYFNYSTPGYQNPANNGFGGARMKFGYNVKQLFYHNKISVNVRTDFNNMPISYTSADRWQSFQFQFATRYNVSKKFNISVRYRNNNTEKNIANVSSSVYGFQQVQVDGGLNYKIGKYYTVSHFSVGKQDISNEQVTQTTGSMLNLSYTQSVVLKKNTLTVNFYYNKELASYQLIGNMLNSELSYQYTLFHDLGVSTGITYLNDAGIASQVGIRETVNLFSIKSFDVNTFLDLRKNLINPLYPDLYANCRAELSLRYHLKY